MTTALECRWVVCNRLDEGRDLTALEWIRPCERCPTSVYVKPHFVKQGYRVTCWWCYTHLGRRLVDIHPQSLVGLDAAGEQEAYLALGEIREWLAQQSTPPTPQRRSHRKRKRRSR
jgi:hypothetical protein